MDTYADRDKVLLGLGFSSYQQYLESPLWQAIRKEVLIRDGCQCRAKRCSQKGAKHAHHVSYSKIVLLGLGCGRIITFCEKHHKIVEYDSINGKKLTLREAAWKTILLTAGVSARRGFSTKSIGFWFRDQTRTSFDTGVRVLERLKRESSEWHKTVAAKILRMPSYKALYRPYL